MDVIPSPPPLPRLLETKSYERSMTYWKCPRITIVSADDKPIAHIPINFVATGGDNTWGYVVRVAREMVIECDGWIFDRGQPVNLADRPFAGTFVYSSQGCSTVQYAPGPSYTTPYKPADIDGSQSQSRHSVATTPKNQVSLPVTTTSWECSLIRPKAGFRNMVRMRDIHCLVTEEFFIQCEAAHIVPQSRPDVYRAIIGLRETEPVNEMYEASAGLLLRNDIHKLFDNLELAFYFKDDMFYVHTFNNVTLFQYHGKAIPSARFHLPYSTYWPNPEYIQWHYRQCLMARFRGFSA